MALVNLKQVCTKAMNNGYAVGNFDVFNVEMLQGVINAATKLKSPVILAFAEPFEAIVGLEEFAEIMKAAAKKACVDVVLHLDHGVNFEIIKRAINAGFTSVMLDASDKTYKENIKLTKEVVSMSKEKNVSVESELGHVGGLEMYKEDYGKDAYTEVAQAKDFVEKTGIDVLAVAIGTVHGVYKTAPKLDFERLAELKNALNIPLAMHGGSGLSDEDFIKVSKTGIAKANIYTDLMIAAKNSAIQTSQTEANYFDMTVSAINFIEKEAMAKMLLFGSNNKA